MKIIRNPKREAWLLDQIRASFAEKDVERNATLHLSDLAKPRMAYWQRVLPIPATDAECLYFLAGRGHEDALGRVAGLVVTEQKTWGGTGPVPIEIGYRPDFQLFGVPAEFKTRRANLAQSGEELVVYENYLTQLRAYAAVEKTTDAVLIVFSLLEGRSGDPKNPTHPEVAMYDVAFTPEELEVEREFLGETAVLLQRALDRAREADGASGTPPESGYGIDAVLSNAHVPLPLCQDWLCGKSTKFITRPAYCTECNKDFSSERYALAHGATKTGAGHHVSAELARWEYLPRCKWYKLCRPWEIDPQRKERE